MTFFTPSQRALIQDGFALIVACALPCWPVAALADDVIAIDAWISAAPPVVHINAGYLNLQNLGDQSLNLVGAESPRFERIEMHRSEIKDGMNSMRRETSLALDAGQSLAFEPGGLHLMLIDPDPAPQPGEIIPLTLIFADGLRVPVNAEVRPAAPDFEPHHH